MEGKINFFQCDDTTGKKPHYKGYIEIDGSVPEFACWPAKSGRGFSGRYKPKTQAEIRQEIKREAAKDDGIPF